MDGQDRADAGDRDVARSGLDPGKGGDDPGPPGRIFAVWRRLAGRLRSRGAPAVVAALCATDALTPSRLPGGLSDRAGRRLFDRLVRFGAVRCAS